MPTTRRKLTSVAEAPEVRIGTAERERALSDLSTHFEAGRLSTAEFDERSATVAGATTRGQLDTVFADLPSLEPEPEAKPAESARALDWRGALTVITPIIALVLFFTVGSWLWFLLIPAVPLVLELGRRLG